MKSPRNPSAPATSNQRTTLDSPVTREPYPPRAAGGWATESPVEVIDGLGRNSAPAEPLEEVDQQQERKGHDEQHQRDGGGALVIVLFQLGHDEERCNLRLHRHVPGDE